MKWLILILSCCSALSQNPLLSGAGIDWTRATATSRWWPTNAANDVVFWGELTPIDGTYDGVLHPVGDNHRVLNWTNFASGSGWSFGANSWLGDQTLRPTNFVSGGGGNSTSPHMLFTAATSTRMTSSTWPVTTNKSTWIFVANCTSVSGTDILILNGTGTPMFQYNAKKLEASQGTTISSSADMSTAYYVITVVFAAGASSHIDTNGVQMVSGNAGSGNMGLVYLGQFNAVCYHGNLSRLWMWNGVLSGSDLSSAVAQCKTDFGIP